MFTLRGPVVGSLQHMPWPRRVHTHWFSCTCLTLVYTRKQRSAAFVTGSLRTFLVVLSLICLVTSQILVSENQMIWRLKIPFRTTVAASLKTKCNGRFVKNKRHQETSKECFTIVQMIVKDEGYEYFACRATFDAWLCPPSPPFASQTHTHT